ncbi:hypothetical protein [Staphylococcus saprophyticus]|uniref:hypothetical protein n=1 Tax=Staphylococcus saprophyticus TaxID=29385 RepID=UPI001F542D56|nr:hypothetical protein [Staphylococcus saprophyticus]MDW3898683.1 hypothetical protein [Staphylococcus saprophyticus]WMM15302.1 hypothetical protein RCG45_11395 [Staphylococcus saprophyticus]
MKKILTAMTIITIIGILAAVGFFGYNKYQEVELEKNKLQAQQKENDDNNSQNISETVNNESQSNEGQNNSQEQENDGSQTVKVHEGSSERTTDKDEFSDLKVNRDNVFDYVIAAVNQTDGGDASLIKFQQPEFSAQDDGIWRIAANNKSGHGSYTFIVDQDGTVQIWDGMMNEKIEEQKVTIE